MASSQAQIVAKQAIDRLLGRYYLYFSLVLNLSYQPATNTELVVASTSLDDVAACHLSGIAWADVFSTFHSQGGAVSCRKDKGEKESKSPSHRFGGDEDLPFFGQTQPRSQSAPKSGLSGISFTSQRPTLLPTVTHRSSTGSSGPLQSPKPNRTLLLAGVAAAVFSMLLCIYMLVSRPASSPAEEPVEEVHTEVVTSAGSTAEPLYTVADVIMRSWKANATASAAQDDSAPRVALCFFGLSRSLKFTLPSIQANIIQPLRDSGYRPTVFLHTYDDSSLDEQSKQTQADEWKLLDPFLSVVTSQSDFLQKHRCSFFLCYVLPVLYTSFFAVSERFCGSLRAVLCY